MKKLLLIPALLATTITPAVSLVSCNNWTNPTDCFTIEALEEGSLYWFIDDKSTKDHEDISLDIEYKINNDEWQDYQFTSTGTGDWYGQTISFVAGDKIQFKGDNPYFSYWKGDLTGTIEWTTYLKCSKQINVSGNLMSLIDNGRTTKQQIPCTACFSNALSGTAVVDASNLTLPRKLTPGCFSSMFRDCHQLINTPTLVAEELPEACYMNMFDSCTALLSTPTMNVTNVGPYSCESMFSKCTRLVNSEITLSATKLASHCYSNMFFQCHALSDVPTIGATKLAESCCEAMFYGCKNITSAPSLHATVLSHSCYKEMFYDCVKLKIQQNDEEDVENKIFICPIWYLYAWDPTTDMFAGCNPEGFVDEPTPSKTYSWVAQQI